MLVAVALVIGQQETVLKIVPRARFVLGEAVLRVTVNLLNIFVTPMREEYVMATKQFINVMAQEAVMVKTMMTTQNVRIKVVGKIVIRLVLKNVVQNIVMVQEIVEPVTTQLVIANVASGQLTVAVILPVPGIKKEKQGLVPQANVIQNLNVYVKSLVVTIGKMRVVVKEVVQTLKCIKLEIVELVIIQNHNVIQILVVELLITLLRPL